MDIEKYRLHLQPLGACAEQETEILLALRGLMKNFVLAAFGKHPVQQVRIADKPTKVLKIAGDSAPVVDFEIGNTFHGASGFKNSPHADLTEG